MRPLDSITRLPQSRNPHGHTSVDPATDVCGPIFLKIPALVRDKIYGHVIGAKDKIYVSQNPTVNCDQLILKHCQNEGEVSLQRDCEVSTLFNSHSGCHTLDTALSFTCRKVHDELLRYLYTYYHLVFVLGEIKVSDLAARFGIYMRNIRVLSLYDALFTDKATVYDLEGLRELAIGLLHLKSFTLFCHIIAADVDPLGFHEEGLLNWFRPLSILPLQHAEVHLEGYGIERPVLDQLEERAVAILLNDPKALEEQQVARPERQWKAKRDTQRNREAARYQFNEGCIIPRIRIEKAPQKSWFEAQAPARYRQRRVSL